MARTITIAEGYSNIHMPNGFMYSAGDQVTLTDEQFERLSPALIGTMLEDGGGGAMTSAGIAANTYEVRSNTVEDLATGVSAAVVPALEDTAASTMFYDWNDTQPWPEWMWRHEEDEDLLRFSPGLYDFYYRRVDGPGLDDLVAGTYADLDSWNVGQRLTVGDSKTVYLPEIEGDFGPYGGFVYLQVQQDSGDVASVTVALQVTKLV